MGWKVLLGAVLLSACASNEPPPEPAEELRFTQLSSDPVEHGKRLVQVLGCSGCHGKDLQGSDWTEPQYGVLWTSNLTRSAERHSDAEMIALITTGQRADRPLMEMPSFLFTNLHPKDLHAITAYLRTLPVGGDIHPEPTIGTALAKEIAAGEYRNSVQDVAEQGDTWPPDMGPDHAYARHIVRATCVECHKMDLRGDDPEKEKPPFSVDLRLVGSYEPADFLKLMRTGKAAGDRELEMMSEVARGRFSHLTGDEVEAIRRYLVALAEVDLAKGSE